MKHKRAGSGIACLILLLTVQSCVRYQPQPLNPVASEAAFRARTIQQTHLDLPALTEIALRYSAEMQLARAKAEVTAAALMTARQRINPSFTGEGGYNRTPESVATYSISPAFTIETAGKRGYRILEAERLAEASRIALYETEWQVRSRVRAAALSYSAASDRLKLVQSEDAVRAEIVEIFAKRVAVGGAATPELDAARSEQAATSVAISNAEGEVSQALAAVAGAAGLPVAALEGKSLLYPALPETMPLLDMQKAGLLHRADVRRTLIEYQASDARLRLEIANQYPNISLNPAYTFQEGFAAYTLGSAIESLPVFHHREGQIAEAKASRHQREAQFLLLQSQVISQTEAAQGEYSAAMREWVTARDVLEPVQQRRENEVVRAFRAGDRDRLDVAQARLLTVTSERTTLEAMLRVQTALIGLENAVQFPLGEKTN